MKCTPQQPESLQHWEETRPSLPRRLHSAHPMATGTRQDLMGADKGALTPSCSLARPSNPLPFMGLQEYQNREQGCRSLGRVGLGGSHLGGVARRKARGACVNLRPPGPGLDSASLLPQSAPFSPTAPGAASGAEFSSFSPGTRGCPVLKPLLSPLPRRLSLEEFLLFPQHPEQPQARRCPGAEGPP